MSQKIQTRLAAALERASKLARKQVVKSAQLERPDRELLVERGYLEEICKGWYLLGRPVERTGDNTWWYAAFWDFLSVYLEERFGDDYCLSAATSMDAHTAANIIPRQVIIVTGKGGKMVLKLPHGTSLMVYQDAKNLPRTVETVCGVRAMPLASALCRMPPAFFENQSINAEIALRAVKSVDDLARIILENESPTLAGRLAGAYQFLGDNERAGQILRAAQAVGMLCGPKNPFAKAAPVFAGAARLVSPYAGRIGALYKTLREPVLAVFKGVTPNLISDPHLYLRRVEAICEHDAYNSLSIEGYRVTPELIEKIRLGEWDPEGDPQDRQRVAAMAAKGYLEAFRRVEKSVTRVLAGEKAGLVVQEDYQEWYRGLFSESVRAGLLEPYHLAGQRNTPVYIRASRHVPPSAESVNDAMEALFDALVDEREPIAGAVLGHWLFGFIHPYMDGNGRMARFLMNVIMASGGYPWTIVRTARRTAYLDALEAASAEQNIVPFAQFIREEMSVDWNQTTAAT